MAERLREDHLGAGDVPLAERPVTDAEWPDEAPEAWDEPWPDEVPRGIVPWMFYVLRYRPATQFLVGGMCLALVAGVVLANSLSVWLPAPHAKHSGASHPTHVQSQQGPLVITLFAPDARRRAQEQETTPLATDLPPSTTSASAGLLPPDRPDPYELGLVAAIGTPEKAIIVSLHSQTMHVYDHGRYLAGTYVITGRPQLPTPTGVYHIFYKLAPATLYSPWPPGSEFYYPPTPVTYTMEFKEGGFLIHDAPWHHVWGPGMNGWHYDPVAKEWQWGSHGRVSAPTPFMQWLYSWSPEGTTVIIY